MDKVKPRPHITIDYGPGISSPMIGLFADILAGGNDLRVRVTGGSMKPFLRSGDIAIIRNVPPGFLKIGDVILCGRDSQELILHRLLNIQKNDPAAGGSRLYTKGDALDRMDMPFQSAQCLGKVVCIERTGRDETAVDNMLCLKSIITNRFLAVYHRLRFGIITVRRILGKQIH